MRPQFLHVDYAKRVRERHTVNRRVVATEHGTFRSAGWSATDLLAEAARKPGHCPHVEAPAPPVLLHGVPPLEVEGIIEEWVQAQHERSKTKAKPRGRRYPKNRPVLAAGVISYPDENAEGWPAYRDACIVWLKRRYGKRLRCVVEHSDESFPHLHYYLVALDTEGFEAVHEGYAAQLIRRREFYAETGRRGKGEKLRTYRVAAMRQLQDDFHAEVSGKFGLMRTGPCRPRTSYPEARQRKRQQQEEADQLALVQWHEERQARQHKDRMALLALPMEHALADNTEGQQELSDHQHALWQLTQDAINTVWKIGSASEIASVQAIAHALVERFNALVRDKQQASHRLHRK